MKKSLRLLSLIFALCFVALWCACTPNSDNGGGNSGNSTPPTSDGGAVENPNHVDYVSGLTLDMNSETKKQEVTVRNYVDGDTTHFHVPKSVNETGVLKARYLAINTPESTGLIEDYGYMAKRFTHDKLASAQSIIVESDDANWNRDSTNERFLVWVWYRETEASPYRNLNIEILQEGLAIASNTSQNRYGEIAMAALMQADQEKLYVHSGIADPEVYHGDAIVLTLKELRANIEDYVQKVVSFDAVIVEKSGQTAYAEAYDEETDMYYGMTLYYGFNANAYVLQALKVGNECRIVGNLEYYETGKSYQISNLHYDMYKPDDPNNIVVISKNNEPSYLEISGDLFLNGQVNLTFGEGESAISKTLRYVQLALSSTVSMKNLYVFDTYTTNNPASSSNGAMTLYCRTEDGHEIAVRTIVLKDENKNVITADKYAGKTISVKGILDYYYNTYEDNFDDYQIKVFRAADIEIVQ